MRRWSKKDTGFLQSPTPLVSSRWRQNTVTKLPTLSGVYKKLACVRTYHQGQKKTGAA